MYKSDILSGSVSFCKSASQCQFWLASWTLNRSCIFFELLVAQKYTYTGISINHPFCSLVPRFYSSVLQLNNLHKVCDRVSRNKKSRWTTEACSSFMWWLPWQQYFFITLKYFSFVSHLTMADVEFHVFKGKKKKKRINKNNNLVGQIKWRAANFCHFQHVSILMQNGLMAN